VARAAVLYGGFMQMIGATQAAIDAVTGLVTLPAEQIEAARAKTLARSAAIQARFSKKSTDEESSEESEMPEAKSSKSSGSKVKVTEAVMKPVAAKPVAAKPVAAKPVAAKPVAAKPVAAKPVAAKPVAAKPVAAKPVAAKELPFCPIDKNASSMIRRLIMEHQLTNEQIIEAMKKVFAGSNLKVSDVSWYRNDLRKKGMNPPDAVK
jgi:spore germination protein GerM